jgi:hypothetical protein
MKKLGKVIRSHIIPYKYYSKDNEYLGKYVVHLPDVWGINEFNIEFMPLVDAYVKKVIPECINLSNQSQMFVWTKWHNIKIDIPCGTNSDKDTVDKIYNDYIKRFEERAAHSRCVGG